MTMTWKKVTEDRSNEMLEILPPAAWTSLGFLVGEPWRHRKCAVTGREDQPAFAAFALVDGQHYELSGPITVAEFRALTPSGVLAHLASG